MKRNIAIFTILIGIILLLFVFSFNHTFPRPYHHIFTKSTDLSKENIEGMFLNNDFNSKAISQKYGKITEQSRDVTNYDYLELKKGIEVVVNKTGKITRFIVTDNKLKTVKGIKIGDKKEDVLRAYGNNYYFRSEQGVNIVGYVDKNSEISIEFWLFDERVVLYRLDNKSME